VAVRLIRLFGKNPAKWGQNQDIDLTSLAVDDFPVNARIKYPRVENRKAAASACHASQGGGGMTKGPIGLIFRLFAGSTADTFMRAYPPVSGETVETDLFEGISTP
jgi:hypothetical protein